MLGSDKTSMKTRLSQSRPVPTVDDGPLDSAVPSLISLDAMVLGVSGLQPDADGDERREPDRNVLGVMDGHCEPGRRCELENSFRFDSRLRAHIRSPHKIVCTSSRT